MIIETCMQANPVIEVEACDAGDVSGRVRLHHVDFEYNVQSKGLRMDPPSCSELELFDVRFGFNGCRTQDCGAFLSTRNRLVNCTVTKTRLETHERSRSLFSAPAGSHTIVERMEAANNSIRIFHIEDGFISIADSSFYWNEFPCLTLNESTAEIDNCRFTHNRVFYSESVIEATDSNVTLSGSTFHHNSAEDDGAGIRAERSVLKLSSVEATGNGARRGGFLFAVHSTLELSSSKAYDNSAEEAGGFIFANRSVLSLAKTRAINNQVRYYIERLPDATEEPPSGSRGKTYEILKGGTGGFMYAIESAVSLDRTRAVNNSAPLGGFISARNSTVEFTRMRATNNTARRGGLVMTFYSELDMRGTKAVGNSADWGGFLASFCSRVSLAETRATSNSAKFGGFIHVRDSILELTHTKAINNTADQGGSVCADDSTVNSTGSLFSEGEAHTSGGFISGEQNSSVFLSDSRMRHGKSKKGGAVALTESELTAKNLSIARCEAHSHGGAIIGSASSTLLCVDCTLRENSAEGGNGGAISFDASGDQLLALQLVQSRILKNRATLGGKHPIPQTPGRFMLSSGGLFYGCKQRKEKCLAEGEDCPFVAATNTTFSDNSAEIAGGAIFAGYMDAVRFRCSADGEDADLAFYKQREWQSLIRLKSVDDLCSSWRHNRAENYGADVATYPAMAQMTVEGDKSKTESGEEYTFKGHRSGKELPTMTVELLDELRQGPARNRRLLKASLSSLDDFLIGTVTMEMKRGTAVFRGIRGFVPAGDHNLTLEFDDAAVGNISIVVSVRNCLIGEVVSTGSLCADCSSTTYNRSHSAMFK